MTVELVQDRLEGYQCKTTQEEINAIKEITQEITLLALSRANFFREAAFHGGTSLRILHRLRRFSEDLDFALRKPNANFRWQPFLNNISNEFKAYGYDIEIQDRAKATSAVRSAFLKDNSIGNLLILRHRDNSGPMRKIRIKLEVDTNPPAGAEFAAKTLDYPTDFNITTHDLPTLFSGKSHALLTRGYLKGRDWYDFLWFATNQTPLNFTHLEHALQQNSKWQGQDLTVNKDWYMEQMTQRIKSIDWDEAKQDVSGFLNASEKPSLELWGEELMQSRLEKWFEGQV